MLMALYVAGPEAILAKIAVELKQALSQRAFHGTPGRATSRRLATGKEWGVSDVLCTSGPSDRAFEERHLAYSIGIVLAGTFQYRRSSSRNCSTLMTPGSLLLGSPGQHFECGHEHGEGDRCVSFKYEPVLFERLARDAAIRGPLTFGPLRLPPFRELAPLVTRAATALAGSLQSSWEELSLQLAVLALRFSRDLPLEDPAPSNASVARVTRIVRHIEAHCEEALSLSEFALETGLTPYHFLRVFQSVAGITPHQFLLRTRLRRAATRLLHERNHNILDIALDSGFGDVSNFTRTFRAEFGATPRQYRKLARSTRSN